LAQTSTRNTPTHASVRSTQRTKDRSAYSQSRSGKRHAKHTRSQRYHPGYNQRRR
jgi:hypothetical protein